MLKMYPRASFARTDLIYFIIRSNSRGNQYKKIL